MKVKIIIISLLHLFTEVKRNIKVKIQNLHRVVSFSIIQSPIFGINIQLPFLTELVLGGFRRSTKSTLRNNTYLLDLYDKELSEISNFFCKTRNVALYTQFTGHILTISWTHHAEHLFKNLSLLTEQFFKDILPSSCSVITGAKERLETFPHKKLMYFDLCFWGFFSQSLSFQPLSSNYSHRSLLFRTENLNVQIYTGNIISIYSIFMP